MPTLDNGGGLIVVLIIIAVLGLALLTRYATQARCSDCGEPVGDRPRFWLIPPDMPPHIATRPLPLCRACFVARGRR